MISLTAGKFVDRRSIKSFLLAWLIVVEILFGSLIAARPDNSYLILGVAIGLIVVVVTFIEPVFGVYVLVTAMFVENLLRLGEISTTRLIIILTFGAWIAHALAHKQFRVLVPLQGWLAGAFAVWGLLSALWGIDTQKLWGALQTMLQCIGLYLLVVNLINSFEKVQVVVAITVLATLALSLLALFRAITGEVVGGRVNITQVFGTGPHALAGYLVPGAAVLIAMLGRESQPIRKLFLLFTLLATALAILATGTRAAVVALAVIAIIGITMERRVWRVLLPGIVMGGLGALFFLPSTSMERLGSILTTSDRGAGRLDIWLVASNIIRSHPILGVGLDNFGQAFDRYLADTSGLRGIYFVQGWGSHNMFLNVQAELGIVGSVLFAAMIGMSVVSGLMAILNLKRAGDDDMGTLTLGLWLGLLGMLVVCCFLDWQYAKYLWLLLAMAEVTRRLSIRTAQSGPL
jgi:O-antigen ligase